MKKIKIFLGGYINSSNAQNLNCLALCKYLDKDKFDISTMSLYSGNLQIDPSIKNKVKIFNCFKPFGLSRKLMFLINIIKSDIVYLPKYDEFILNNILIKIFKTKSFITIENIYDRDAIQNAVNHIGSEENIRKLYHNHKNVYSITKFMRRYNLEKMKIKSKDKVLYLGTEIETFLNQNKKIENLNSVLIIGNDLIRKGIYDYLKLVSYFPDINFHIVGSGNGKIDMNKIIEDNKIKNIVYHGTLSHQKIVELLKIIDLHIFPSHSEGFPKVTLETAASGVPSLVYSDYGADEWITHNHDGFVVNTLDDMKEVIQELKNNPEQLKTCSNNAIELAKKFDWKILVKEWENEIINIVGSKQ